MILLKHNAIENFASFTRQEKEDLIIQELSKAFMLYPRATADILDTCSITYKSLKLKDLAFAVQKGHDNLKMLNRIVRLSFLVNRQGDNNLKNHSRSVSFRSVMRDGKPFLEENREVMKEATLIARDMMRNGVFTQVLGKNIDAYAALDGGKIPSHDEERERIQEEVKPKNNSHWWWILGSIVTVGGLLYFLKKSKE